MKSEKVEYRVFNEPNSFRNEKQFATEPEAFTNTSRFILQVDVEGSTRNAGFELSDYWEGIRSLKSC